MQTSDKALKQISRWEGYKSRAYRCPAGVWTIGHGHTKGVKEGDTITYDQALEMFKVDIKEFEGYVLAYFGDAPLTQSQFDAAVSFCYNAGPGNLAKSVWARLLKVGEAAKASEALAQWGNKQFSMMPGLRIRRAEEGRWVHG